MQTPLLMHMIQCRTQCQTRIYYNPDQTCLTWTNRDPLNPAVYQNFCIHTTYTVVHRAKNSNQIGITKLESFYLLVYSIKLIMHLSLLRLEANDTVYQFIGSYNYTCILPGYTPSS